MNAMNREGWRRVLFAGLALTLLGAALVTRTLHQGPMPAGDISSVTEVRDEAPLPAFALQGQKGNFTNADLQGRWTFMFFGYTQCPDICPTALTLMKDVKARLDGGTAKSSDRPPQVVFVSVDPRRDSAELLVEYMAAFDPAFVGLRGDDAALLPLTGNLGVYYQRNDAADKQRYTVDHSAAIYLVDPAGKLRAVFSPPHDAGKMAGDYVRIKQN
jgi:protein SCO1/2